MEFSEELKHVGVLGMRWGRRKAKESVSPEDRKFNKQKSLLLEAVKKKRIRSEVEVHNLSDKDIKKLVSDKVMSKKLKHYENERNKERIAKAAKLTALTIFLASAFGPSVYNGGKRVYRFAQMKKYYDMADKYGGYDPKLVVNAKFL